MSPGRAGGMQRPWQEQQLQHSCHRHGSVQGATPDYGLQRSNRNGPLAAAEKRLPNYCEDPEDTPADGAEERRDGLAKQLAVCWQSWPVVLLHPAGGGQWRNHRVQHQQWHQSPRQTASASNAQVGFPVDSGDGPVGVPPVTRSGASVWPWAEGIRTHQIQTPHFKPTHFGNLRRGICGFTCLCSNKTH